MKVRVLGCSGGIGGRHLRTTAMLVDHDILIDAGTGIADLSIAELAAIDHVFLTHSHLDHVVGLPLMLDSVTDSRTKPVTVYGTSETLSTLREHIFNWDIWPDFSTISVGAAPAMEYKPIRVGQPLQLGSRIITPVPAEHSVPAVGYHLDSGAGSLVFTGDTTVNDAFWRLLNTIANLRYLIVETAFSNREERMAAVSKHLCPNMLGRELRKLMVSPRIYISHLKPGQVELIMGEIEQCAGELKPEMLQNNQVFEF